MIGGIEAYRPVKALCAQTLPVKSPWRKALKAQLDLVPQLISGEYRVVGRTNLPDDTVLWTGLGGFGGAPEEVVVVEGGCFVSPAFEPEPGMYVLSVGIRDLSGLDSDTAAVLEESGPSRKKEFVASKLVGAGANPEKSYKAHLALWAEFSTVARELLQRGNGLTDLRRRSAAGDTEAGIECTRGRGERQRDRQREPEERFAKYQALNFIFGADLSLIQYQLSVCMNCDAGTGDKGCKDAAKLLKAGKWKADDIVAEFRAGHR